MFIAEQKVLNAAKPQPAEVIPYTDRKFISTFLSIVLELVLTDLAMVSHEVHLIFSTSQSPFRGFSHCSMVNVLAAPTSITFRAGINHS